jgi:formate dehydrogenase
MPKSSAATPRAPRPYGKGRIVDLQALTEVREALGDVSRQRDLLIEHLHAVRTR